MDGLIQALGKNKPSGSVWTPSGIARRPLRSAAKSSKSLLRLIPLLISTILLASGHPHLHAQGVTTEEPPSAPVPNQNTSQTSAPDLATIPHAYLLPPARQPETAILESDRQSKHGDIAIATGSAVLTYGDHILRADTLTYDDSTGEVTATGHVDLTGGENDEHITASHGTYNIRTTTGTFYDVNGSVEMQRATPVSTFATPATPGTTAPATHIASYQNSNPFLFEGRVVIKTSPTDYTIYNGSITTCLLPNPDWQLFSRKITMKNGKAQAANSTFTLIGIPMFFFPYVTHPADSQQRQSGLLIPEFGYSSASKDTGAKGTTIGEQLYLVLGRSADLTLGTIYYSLRGFAENGTFRYHGTGDNFFNAHFSALQDRGFNSTAINAAGQAVTIFNNQGGQDVTSSFRYQLTPTLRAVGDAEYLSSFIYREAFTPNFNQAVSTDITSILSLADQKNGFSTALRVDRYEGLKVVQTDFTPGEEVKIYHAPSIDFTGLDHHLAGTPLLWSVTASTTGLKRVEPDFATAGLTWRLDLRPELSLPLRFDGWHILASVAVRETAYTRSRQTPYGNNATPIQLKSPLNRSDADLNLDIRPPAVERTFTVPERWRHLFGDEVRHTIEPEITYRNTHGIDNFFNVLRFDDVDLASDTDELQYGVTQHLYFKPHPKTPAKPKPGCPTVAKPVFSTEDAAIKSVLSTRGAAAVERPAVPPTTSIPTISGTEPDTTTETPAIDTDADSNAPGQPLRTHARTSDPCAQPPTIPPQQEWFSWILTQKTFFEPTFGGAVINERRNIFDTTLGFSGIAFLTQPRSISPLKSRMRFRTSSHADIAWDFDYDTGAKKFTSSNTFLDLHEGKIFGGFSYARLNAPGKAYTEVINTTTNTVTGLTSSAISDFSQMRLLFGYGKPSDAGFSGAVSTGLDLKLDSAQYITIQTSYNWNCCGLALELRHYNLGTIRDEWAPTFSFTLANIGSAGDLRRAASLF